MLPALATTFLFALTAVCATQAAVKVGSHQANFIRLVLALFLLGIWHLMAGKPVPWFPKMEFMLAGAIGFGIGGMCMFQAFPRIGSTLSLLVVECASAVFSMILGWIWLKQGVSHFQLIFALFSIGGVIVGLFPREIPQSTIPVIRAGVFFTIAASLGQSFSFLITKHAFTEIAQTGMTTAPMSAAVYRLIGGSTIAGIVLLFALRKSQLSAASAHTFFKKAKPAWPWMIANAVAGPVLGVTCMLWAIREVGNPGLVQSVVATATLVSVPLSRLTEKRKLERNYYIGAVISIIGTTGLLTSPFAS